MSAAYDDDDGNWWSQQLRDALEDDEAYLPSEDTFFLADYINGISDGSRALDVGSGSGYITKILCDRFKTVVGTDIILGVLNNQSAAYRTENLVCCSGSDALHAKFDLIVCNPPYLATESITYAATDGGPGGLVAPSVIINSVCNNIATGGRFAFVSTTLSDYDRLIQRALHVGFAEARIVSRKKLFFEELVLIECLWQDS